MIKTGGIEGLAGMSKGINYVVSVSGAIELGTCNLIYQVLRPSTCSDADADRKDGVNCYLLTVIIIG